MKTVVFSILISFLHYARAEGSLCGNNSIIRTSGCSTQLTNDHFDYEPCKVEYFPANSNQCKDMTFGRIEANEGMGGVRLRPYTMTYVRSDTMHYSVNYTALSITFTNIKWKTMKFRFQRYGDNTLKNHCRNIFISSDVAPKDGPVLHYDCFFAKTDGNYNGHGYVLDFEASDDRAVNRGQFYFNVPTGKMLGSSVSMREWKPFTYIERHIGTLILHILPPPTHITIDSYRIELMKACDKRTNCEEIVKNATLPVSKGDREVTFEYSLSGNAGSAMYYFVVTPSHENCSNDKSECLSVNSPTVVVDIESPTIYIIIASIIALIVAVLFVYYIAPRLVRQFCRKDDRQDTVKKIPPPPKILVVYSPTNEAHALCVESFISYLRSVYGLEMMYDGDIASTSHADPYIWNQEAFQVATHVIYVVSPAANIVKQPFLNIHSNIEALQLHTLTSCRFKKDVINVRFEHSSVSIPVETLLDKEFRLLKDWEKMIKYLTKGLLPKQQMERTEKGKLLLESLKNAKNMHNTKTTNQPNVNHSIS